jgi:calcineurin-like phosphoesterase family protein
MKKEMNIWFTSDTHYGHKNIAGKEVSRWTSGFRKFASVQQMNEALIANINKYVKEDDILYHLGDFAFGDAKTIREFRNSLVCKNIHLILGNHDEEIEDSLELQELFTSVGYVMQVRHGKHKFFLSHYPHLSWHHAAKGVIMLHGHEHGSFDHLNRNVLRMDVGIDSAEIILGMYRPFSIEEVISINTKKRIIPIKHH